MKAQRMVESTRCVVGTLLYTVQCTQPTHVNGIYKEHSSYAWSLTLMFLADFAEMSGFWQDPLNGESSQGRTQ